MPRKHNNAEDLRHCLANCLKTEKNKATFFLSNPIHIPFCFLFNVIFSCKLHLYASFACVVCNLLCTVFTKGFWDRLLSCLASRKELISLPTLPECPGSFCPLRLTEGDLMIWFFFLPTNSQDSLLPFELHVIRIRNAQDLWFLYIHISFSLNDSNTSLIVSGIWLLILIWTPSILPMVLRISISVFTQELICFPADA